MNFKFKIDEKSLFYGLYNDYSKGQTATVSTPVNQSKDRKKWHNDIIQLFDSGLDIKNIPQELVDKCLNKTTSQANSKLNYFYEFKNIYLDGEKLNCRFSFGIYAKEEIDKTITNKKGKVVTNTHLGRIKLHYPISLKYTTDGFNIDNTNVLQSILIQNKGFAFVVRGFECDTEENSINFLTSMIGLKGLFLSSVFKKKKGVGKKLLVDEINLEAQDLSTDSLVLISHNLKESTNDTNFDQINKSRVENGKLGEKYVYENITKIISEYAREVYHTSKDYPTSPYDIEYLDGNAKKYIEVKSTSGTKEVFNMSSGEIKFMEKYKDNYTLVLVTDVKSDFPTIKKFKYEDIKKMKKEYPSTRFYAN